MTKNYRITLSTVVKLDEMSKTIYSESPDRLIDDLCFHTDHALDIKMTETTEEAREDWTKTEPL